VKHSNDLHGTTSAALQTSHANLLPDDPSMDRFLRCVWLYAGPTQVGQPWAVALLHTSNAAVMKTLATLSSMKAHTGVAYNNKI